MYINAEYHGGWTELTSIHQSSIKISPWLLYASFLLFCQLLRQFFSIESLMGWQRFEIIQLFLNAKLAFMTRQ